MKNPYVRLSGLLCGILLLGNSAAAQVTVPASAFVDSVGVNVHLHYNGTLYYDNFDLLKSRLQELGVRHLRDGIIDTSWQGYYERHRALGRIGIKGAFIAPLEVSTDLLRSFPGRVPESFEAYEGPNEANDSGDPQWVSRVRTTLQQLRSMRDQPGLQSFPVYGPSLTSQEAYAALGKIEAYIDAANMHNYFSGRNPGTSGWGDDGYGSIVWNMRLASGISGSKPIVTTETGYQDDPALVDSAPELIVGRYMPRLLLEQFRAGITRTYIYEMADFTFENGSSSGRYGLLASDGRPKPSYNAVKSLLTLLADSGTGNEGPALQYQIEGGTGDLHHMAFSTRDGRYFVTLWLERSSYDVGSRRILTLPGEQVTLKLPGDVSAIASYAWQDDGNRQRTVITPTRSVPLSVGDALMVIEVQATRNVLAPQRLRIVR